MNIDEFFHHCDIHSYSEIGLGIWKVDPDFLINNGEIQIKAHVIIFVKTGVLNIKIDGDRYMMTVGDYSDITEQSLFIIESAAKGTEALCFMINEQFFLSTFKSRPPMEMAYVDYILAHRIVKLGYRAIETLSVTFASMLDTLTCQPHPYQTALLQMKIKILYLEIQAIFTQFVTLKEDSELFNDNRQQYLFSKFVNLLTHEAITEHSVDFYARKLCISSQYLGRVVHNVGHEMVSTLISRAVIGHVERLLTESSLSLKEIAELANFGDQTVLSKYFKRHTGLTPSQYRRSLTEK
jgi:AraC-like DNA-binding protein